MYIRVNKDSVDIEGYVNAVERLSKPLKDRLGSFVERVKVGAFQRALDRADDVRILLNHDWEKDLGGIKDGNLELNEDAIGLHADVLITDPTVIEIAKKGKIKGWSFGMYNVEDELEQRADELPIRHVKGLELDHISLVAGQTPVYSATSVECRADTEICIETRSLDIVPKLSIEKIDYSEYKERIEKLMK